MNGQLGVTILGMSLAEVALALAATAWVIDRILDAVGRTPGARRLREENLDLVRRNDELEATIVRDRAELDASRAELTEAKARITALEVKVQELEKRDQAAVLASLDIHEKQAQQRYENVKASDERRHVEMLAVFKEISETLTEARRGIGTLVGAIEAGSTGPIGATGA